MAIRWIHRAVDKDGIELDIRLMSLKDLWTICYKKAEGITYAWLESYLQELGFRPVAVDDKQVMYYACLLEKSGKSEKEFVPTFLTGEEFFSMVYCPFGTDEMVIHSPVVFPIGRVQVEVLLQNSNKDKGGSPSKNQDKGFLSKFLDL